MTSVSGTDAFSPDYFAARYRFRQAARRAGLTVETHAIDQLGPGGEELTIDVVILGDRKACAVLVVSGGLHGVEGFLGSAVELELLNCGFAGGQGDLPVAVVLIHSLNPFGYAHLRRVNEDNVDPNRNFLTAIQHYCGCPDGYHQLDRLLNPKRPPSRLDTLLFQIKTCQAVCRLGIRTIKHTVARGQYEYPKGIFYGGTGPSQLTEILRQNLPRWIDGAKRVLHLDLHTGLGRWASHKLLVDTTLPESRMHWLRAHFGGDRIEKTDAQQTAFCIHGSFGNWCHETFPNCDYSYLCVEFGTYSPLRMLAGLRAENQAHHWGRNSRRALVQTRQRLRNLFCPPSRRWRQAALGQSLDLVQTSIDALRLQGC